MKITQPYLHQNILYVLYSISPGLFPYMPEGGQPCLCYPHESAYPAYLQDY
jgi:hypothetical protein